MRFFLLFVSVFFHHLCSAATEHKSFIPVLVCDQVRSVTSLSIYEAKTFRSQKYPEEMWTQMTISEQLEHSTNILSRISKSRSLNYKNRALEIIPKLKWLTEANFRKEPSYNEIAIPLNCEIETLAVIEFDSTYHQVTKGYFNKKLWEKLPPLDQEAILLEVLVSEELNLPEGGDIGRRAFVGYALSSNSPLYDVATKFEVMQRIGFTYAESSLCVKLDSPFKFLRGELMEGTSFSDIFKYRECFLEVQGQKINPAGYFSFYEPGKFKFLSVAPALKQDQNYYEDRTLSSYYGLPIRLTGTSQWSSPLRFHPNGLAEYGHFLNEKSEFLRSKNVEISITDGSQIAFWENGALRRIEKPQGKVFIQGKWHEINGQNLLLYSNGTIECAEFSISAKLRRKNGSPLKLDLNNRYVCFTEVGDLIEEPYTSSSSTPFTRKNYFPFWGEGAFEKPWKNLK